MRSFEETALAFDRACRSVGVAYALIGGMAVNAWGQPRNTAGIDVLVDLPPARIDALVAALGKEGLEAGAADFRLAFDDPAHVTVFTSDPALHFDVKLALRAEEKEQVRDAATVEYFEGQVRVVRPEETVAFKLRFGSPQDLADARIIVERQGPRLDRGRLDAFALRLGVADDLARLLAEVRGGRGGDQ